MDSTPSSCDSEAVNLRAASSLSDVFFDAEEVLRTESAVAAAAQESTSGVASSEDNSVASSSNKSVKKKSSGGFELLSDDELEQRLWRQHVDSMLTNINLTPPSSVLAEREAVRKMLKGTGEGTEESRRETIVERLNVPHIEGVSLHTALLREADAEVTQTEQSLETIPYLCLSPVGTSTLE